MLTLTLNRPERLNALNVALIEALLAAARARGGGSRLPRGSHHRRRQRASAPGRTSPTARSLPAGPGLISAKRSKRASIRWSARIRSLPKPVVCAVNGPAAGAGANLALACDIVLAAKSAQFLQAFARIGLIPDAGGTFILPRLVGEARARALMMLADPIGAEEAAAWGMIYRAVDDEDLMGEARTIAERLAAGPTHAFGLIKRALAASASASLDAQLDLERDLQREAGATGRICRRRARVSGEAAGGFRARRASQAPDSHDENGRPSGRPDRSHLQSRGERGRRPHFAQCLVSSSWRSALVGIPPSEACRASPSD